MADSYWIWSHGFKVHDEEHADPLRLRFTQEQLEAMSDMESMAAFIGRCKDISNAEDFPVERQAYIIKHALEYERIMIGHPYTLNGEDRVLKALHVRVRLDAARAVEFKIRFHVFNLPKSL